MASLKEKILKYKEKHDLSYRELADLLDLENHQNFYYWLHNEPGESFGEKVERKFATLLKG